MTESGGDFPYETRVYGYARVSTEDQNLDMQLQALEEYGCTFVFKEKKSAYRVKRKQLEWLKKSLAPGDTLVVWKLDRLGRDVGDLIKFMGFLKDRDINFVSLRDQIDTRTAMGNFMFHLLASLAQLERDLTSERTKAGIAAKKKRGWSPGPKMLKDRIPAAKLAAIRADLANPKMSWAKLKDKYGHSVTTLRKNFLEERDAIFEKMAEEDETE
ncbi:recombinase family protein [uncultured Roseibium sp.]|uniref:recombinase family protein n=1 Tax=uncultured Roseibium sp. TaxID=1936171 RepID=UPI002628A976|nr:recombinase family protein [uncultured Roseibium sp.]